ncbi:MAG: hypothetical protein KatS3mg087_1973 [Patescibacteria group bacterium]|uniref:fibronectin type III domain-containing protein n=1 Tax=Thermonema sp. TaxID=2231181 RepID=UPI0021DDCAB8|nr:fibronectin type III domain-containing protein [Thermonema sp.]GIV38686.1 MAG: hypothetical protein KatS3mg033_0486 [Thermonema sp.]GIW60907.1 MAG: hypothetical protein KatS3mg087_1973 [Patescibacteria group bacterium]
MSPLFKTRVALLWLLCLLFCGQRASAQNYPIRTQVLMQPPYSPYLADYTEPATSRLQLQVIAEDISLVNYPVRLRLVIEGANISIYTRPDYKPEPIYLQGGVPLILSGAELAPYFDAQNLIFKGIDRNEFLREKRLPDGFYTIRFEVSDYNRDILLSNPNVGQQAAWIMLNDPPMLNMPYNGDKIKPLPQQNVVFSWTPRHTSNPNAARNVEYELTLVELIPADRNPNDAILSSIPIYRTTTTATQLVYGITEPPLTLGRKYAWRVQAKERSGLNLFKNRGFSEVFVFQYGDACECPETIGHEIINPEKVKINWSYGKGTDEYSVLYRKKGTENWIATPPTVLAYTMLRPLQAGTTYEYKLKASCGGVAEVESPVKTFTTPAPIELEATACGQLPPAFNPQTDSVYMNLHPGDTIRAYDFDAVVKTLEIYGDGYYGGTAIAELPFANRAKIKYKMDMVRLNAQKQMIEGRLIAMGMGIEVMDTQTMEQIEQLLDDIDMLLQQAENTIEVVDLVLAKMEQLMQTFKKYLPEDILHQINVAQEELVHWKNEYQKAKTQLDDEEVDVAAVKDSLRQARVAVRQAYADAASYWAQALVDMVSIVWKAILKIKEEVAQNPEIEEKYKEAETDIFYRVFEKQGVTFQDSVTSAGMLIPRVTSFGKTLEELSNESEELYNNIVADIQRRELYARWVMKKLAEALVAYYASEEKVNVEFQGDAAMKGEEILDFILLELKKRTPKEEIVVAVKDNMLDSLAELAQELIEQMAYGETDVNTKQR